MSLLDIELKIANALKDDNADLIQICKSEAADYAEKHLDADAQPTDLRVFIGLLGALSQGRVDVFKNSLKELLNAPYFLNPENQRALQALLTESNSDSKDLTQISNRYFEHLQLLLKMGLQDKYNKLLSFALHLFPGNPRFLNLNRNSEMEKASHALQKNTSIGQSTKRVDSHLDSEDAGKELAKSMMATAAKNPSLYYEFGLFFYNIDYYKTAAQFFTRAPETAGCTFFLLQSLLLARQYYLALSQAEHFFGVYKSAQPILAKKILYFKSIALWFMGSRAEAQKIWQSLNLSVDVAEAHMPSDIIRLVHDI